MIVQPSSPRVKSLGDLLLLRLQLMELKVVTRGRKEWSQW